mgnify:CR=1 FL=1
MKPLYFFGTVLLFIGLFWMFLPHATHEKIISADENLSHITHIFQGVVLVIIGLAVMIFSNKLENRKN